MKQSQKVISGLLCEYKKSWNVLGTSFTAINQLQTIVISSGENTFIDAIERIRIDS